MVEQAQQPVRGAVLAFSQIAGGIDGNTRRRGAEQENEERRERVEPQMDRQVGQAERQDAGLRFADESAECAECAERQDQTERRADRKEDPGDQPEVPGEEQAGTADRQPCGDDEEEGVEHKGLSHGRRSARDRAASFRAESAPPTRAIRNNPPISASTPSAIDEGKSRKNSGNPRKTHSAPLAKSTMPTISSAAKKRILGVILRRGVFRMSTFGSLIVGLVMRLVKL